MSIHHLPSATDDALAEQAAQWLMRVTDPDARAEDHAACIAWRSTGPRHEQAWQQAVRFWQRRELAAALASASADIPGTMPAPAARRRFLRLAQAAAAVLLVAVLAGGLLGSGPGMGIVSWALADLRAPLNGMTRVTLEDGSRLTLDAGAAVDVEFSPAHRHLHLRGGAIAIEAVPDAQRPLSVETARATVTVVGTRFLVAQGEDRDRIAVQSGRVSVRNQAGAPVYLTAGQQLYASATRLEAAMPVDPNSVADFAAGWRSYEATPLKDVLAEIARYRWMPVIMEDEAIGRLPVTARLQVAEPARALAGLLATMPLQVQSWPGGLLRLRRTTAK